MLNYIYQIAFANTCHLSIIRCKASTSSFNAMVFDFTRQGIEPGSTVSGKVLEQLTGNPKAYRFESYGKATLALLVLSGRRCGGSCLGCCAGSL